MEKLYALILFFFVSAGYSQVLNEFEPNPAGGDPADVSVELKGTPNMSFSGWILSIESDEGTSSGIVDRATNVSGTFSADGLLVVSIPDLENPSFTVVLASDFTGTVGTTDIDTDNNGVADDVSSIGTIYDAIGIPDNTTDEAFLYGADLGGADFVFTGQEPELVFRDATTGNWYAVNQVMNTTVFPDVFDISANTVATASFNFDPIATGATFGQLNAENSGTASVDDNKIIGFKMYPNPVSDGNLFIESLQQQEKFIEIFDVLGKKVLTKNIKRSFVNVSSLKSGVYILKVTENRKTVTRKLVIK